MKKVKITRGTTRQFSGDFKGNPIVSPWYSGSNPTIDVNKTLKEVPEHLANVEAEKDETVMFPKNSAFGDFPSLYDVAGKRHVDGGTNLSLPEDSFVFSDTKEMKIKDKTILAMFGKNVGKKGKKQFTPAELSKKYQINDFLKTLADPDSTKEERETAEQMIKNYQMKLGQLALVQESSKGFPDGIPAVAVPYLYTVGVDPNAILGTQQNNTQPMQTAKFGGGLNRSEDFGSEKKPYPTVSSNDFAGSGRSYPIPTIEDAEDALKLAHLHGRNDVVSKVYSKYPELKKKQKGGPQKGDIIVEYSDDPYTLEENIFNAQKANPDKTVYVKGADGTYKTVQGKVYPRTKYEGKQNFGDYKKSYEQLYHLLSTDDNLRKIVYDNYIKRITDKDRTRNKISDSRKEKLSKIPVDQVINDFLRHQEQVYALQNNPDIDLEDLKDKWDTGKKNSVYKETMKGMGLDPLSDDEIAVSQAVYYALNDAKQHPEYKDKLNHLMLGQRGKKDEIDDRISPIDDWFGNTTAGQLAYSAGEYTLEDILKDKDKVEKYNIPQTEYTEQGIVNPDWWQQDVNNLGVAAGNFLGVKKYNPNLQTIDLQEPSPTFISPERALAANAEQANIAQNAIGAFAGPQSLSARQSNIQGTAAKNAADILAQTHNQNVDIANQFELAQKNIRNQETGANAQNAQNFYDQTVIANQQYDNEKNQAEQVMLANYNQGLTNAQMTAAQNAMYPHYQTDPTTGQVYFNRGSKMKHGTDRNNPPGFDAYLQAVYENPNIDPNDIAKFFGNYTDPGEDATQNYGTGNIAMYPGMYQKRGGTIMKRVKIKRLPNK
jgi:hypothetical protein